MIVKVTALCVAVAMICSTLRLQRPELATALSLAAGMAILVLMVNEARGAMQWTENFQALLRSNGDVTAAMLKGAGIAVVSELGAQLCADAGERALAGRITLAGRVAMLSLCAPLLGELTETIVGAIG